MEWVSNCHHCGRPVIPGRQRSLHAFARFLGGYPCCCVQATSAPSRSLASLPCLHCIGGRVPYDPSNGTLGSFAIACGLTDQNQQWRDCEEAKVSYLESNDLITANNAIFIRSYLDAHLAAANWAIGRAAAISGDLTNYGGCPGADVFFEQGFFHYGYDPLFDTLIPPTNPGAWGVVRATVRTGTNGLTCSLSCGSASGTSSGNSPPPCGVYGLGAACRTASAPLGKWDCFSVKTSSLVQDPFLDGTQPGVCGSITYTPETLG